MTPIEAAWQHRAPDLEGMTMADLPSNPDPFSNIAITPPTWWQLLKRLGIIYLTSVGNSSI